MTAVRVVRDRLKHPDAGVRFQASTALGRIADRSSVSALIEALDERDPFARYAAFTALNRIGRADPTAWRAIIGGLAHPEAEVREGVRMALRATESEPLVRALADFAGDGAPPADARADALRLVAAVHKRLPAWKGEWWAYHPALSPPPRPRRAGLHQVPSCRRLGRRRRAGPLVRRHPV